MIDGVKSFQKDEGLKVDGVMKPDGPTINRLYRKLSAERLNFRVASNDGAKKSFQNGKPVQVAVGPALPLFGGAAWLAARIAAPKAGKALIDASRTAGAAVTAQNLLEQRKKRTKNEYPPTPANDPYARSEISESPRQIPSLTPPNVEELSKGGKTKSPGTPLKKPQLDGFPSDRRPNTDPMIFEELNEEMKNALKGAFEHRGDKYTKRGHDLIVDKIWDKVMSAYGDKIKGSIEHFGGGITTEGTRKKEEYVKKKNAGKKGAGTKDSSYPDLSFSKKAPMAKDDDDKIKLRVNTGKMLKDGKTPIASERRQLLKLRNNEKLRDVAGTLPKLRRGMSEEEYIERVTPLLKDLIERWIGPPLP